MIKWCLHLPFSQSLAAHKSSASIFWFLASALTVGPQLLVFSANGSCFLYSKQPNRTNIQQTQLRTTEHSQEMFEEITLNDMACCYGHEAQERLRTELSLKRTRLSRLAIITEKITISLIHFS